MITRPNPAPECSIPARQNSPICARQPSVHRGLRKVQIGGDARLVRDKDPIAEREAKRATFGIPAADSAFAFRVDKNMQIVQICEVGLPDPACQNIRTMLLAAL